MYVCRYLFWCILFKAVVPKWEFPKSQNPGVLQEFARGVTKVYKTVTQNVNTVISLTLNKKCEMQYFRWCLTHMMQYNYLGI